MTDDQPKRGRRSNYAAYSGPAGGLHRAVPPQLSPAPAFRRAVAARDQARRFPRGRPQGQRPREALQSAGQYPPAAERNGASPDAPQRYAALDAAALAEANLRAVSIVVEVGMPREQLGDTRRDRDAWREQAQRLALPKPAAPILNLLELKLTSFQNVGGVARVACRQGYQGQLLPAVHPVVG